MYLNKFVLSVIHGGYPVKEFGAGGIKRVALPFNSEYKIHLKNKNDRSCTAKVLIDGKEVSKLGDFIIHSNGIIDLERFVDSSLEHGKKFRFVPLDHPDVDDPTSGENGIIKVEFKLARKENNIKINVWPPNYQPWQWYEPFDPLDGPQKRHISDPILGAASTFSQDSADVSYCCSNLSMGLSDGNIEKGATVEGGRSNQSFSYSSLDVEDLATTLQLKIVGIKDTKQADKLVYKYCFKCGNKVERTNRYCSGCGTRL